MKRNTIAFVAAGIAAAFGASTGVATLTGAPALADSGTAELFIQSATQLNPVAETVSLPLFKGKTASGDTTWYVVTESSDRDDAERRGVNPAPKLANALGTRAVQKVTRRNGLIHFAGTPNFSPERVVVPSSPNGFPPDVAKPGAIGDAAYSPLITTGNGIVLNASQVKNSTGVHDSLVSINWSTHRVTMSLFKGFYNGKSIIYLRLEGSLPLLAAIESTTYAPNLNAAPGIASDDPDTSAREAIIPAVNGPRGVNNPQRQGLESALLGQGDPLNIIQEEPGDERYSPVWDVTPYVWTKAAIAAGERHRLRGAGEVRNEFSHGNIVSAGFSKGPHNESLEGLRAAGFISNCPVVALLG
ncbi:MAG: hypothetical protein H0V07_02700 [Propionibacteriales bacterium]|nr:hypothetical protein [Propionibacteriales bacterium]